MNISVLIDAENVQPAHAEQIFTYADSQGCVVHKEIYGAAQALSAWVEPVLKYAIHSNMTLKAAKGKNSSDIALVIGAMDILAGGDTDRIVIASSDSDFSHLSIRLRNSGMEVIGMGTEKANPLWRCACSGFVVLQQNTARQPQQNAGRQPQQQNAKAAKPAPAKPAQQPKPAQQTAPAQQTPEQQQPEKPQVSASHTERTAIIKAFIAEQLQANGGRMQISTLFSALNGLPEYKVDQQRSKRRPLNYLTRQFSGAFSFEEVSDGNNYISLRSPDKAEAETAGAKAETPAPEESAVQPQGAKDARANGDPGDPLTHLIAGGFSEEDARKLVEIFTGSASRREAYNKLRTTFGNTTGRDYYQRVKEISDSL